MANVCDFELVVYGKKKDVDRCINIFMGKSRRQLCRIDDIQVDDIQQINQDYCKAFIVGTCAWSVYTSMMSGVLTYYSELSKNDSSSSSKITIPEISAKYNLDIEIYSKETGMGVAEHYQISKGDIILAEDAPYNEYYIEGFKTYEDFCNYWSEFDNNIRNIVSEFDFDIAKKYNQEYIVKGNTGYVYHLPFNIRKGAA